MQNIEIYVGSITPVNVFYIARKEIGKDLTLKAIENLLVLAKVCIADSTILKSALNSPISDYEDAVQHACAVAEKLDCIITRNTKDYKNSTLPIYSPTEFLDFLKTS